MNGEQYLRINETPGINYKIPKMIYDLCYDKYNYRKYIPNKLFLCEDINIEYNYNNSSTNSLFNIFHLLEMSLYQIKQLLLNGEFISTQMIQIIKYFQKKVI